MPNLAMAEESILSAFHTAWANRTPVEWPNLADQDGKPPLNTGNVSWARFTILHGGSDQHSFGGEGERTFTREGRLMVQIFVPAGKRGLEEATTLAMVAANAYEGKTLGGVRFYRVGSKTVGQDGPWFQVNVSADFEFDEVK